MHTRVVVRSLLGASLIAIHVACGSAGDGQGSGDAGQGADTGGVDCTAGPAAGCPCNPAADITTTCYEGPSGTQGVGECRAGLRACRAESATWTECTGQVLPEVEMCDGLDNSCNGEVDDGVKSACGNCDHDCSEVTVGDDPFPMPDDDPDVKIDGVGLDPNGDLVLDSSTVTNHYLWVANDPEGTVSKIDTRTGREIARYVSQSSEVIVDVSGGAAGDLPALGHARPSRTAVDFDGNVWVANRTERWDDSDMVLQASATKIMNVVEECVDRNGNGEIETSHDANGDGIIDINDPEEFFGESDECVVMTVVMNAPGDIARALAISSGYDPGDPGNVWVGMWEEGAFYELNGASGSLVRRVPEQGSLGIRPYGAAVDSKGQLWATHGCCNNRAALVRIDTFTGAYTSPIELAGVTGRYGIVIDLEDRIWIGAWTSRHAKRYDPVLDETVDVELSEDTARLRGMGVDTHGNVWAAVDEGGNRMVRIDADNADVTLTHDIGDDDYPIGIGVDFDGNVWTVNQAGSSVARLHIDQTTLEPAPHPDTGNVQDIFTNNGPSPYTYSDFTGLSARVVTRPTGDYVVPLQGCPDGAETNWNQVTWEATTPPETKVEVYVRVGDDLATLGQATRYGPWTESPADLQAEPGPVPDGRYLQLTLRLISEDKKATPIVHGYSVQWSCPTPPLH